MRTHQEVARDRDRQSAFFKCEIRERGQHPVLEQEHVAGLPDEIPPAQFRPIRLAAVPSPALAGARLYGVNAGDARGPALAERQPRPPDRQPGDECVDHQCDQRVHLEHCSAGRLRRA